MEIQKMRNEMWLKIQNRIMSLIKKKVADRDLHGDILSNLCILFLERYTPVCRETGSFYTEEQAISFCMGLQFRDAMRETIEIPRLRCESKVYLAAKAAATTLEELENVEDTFRPEITFVEYDAAVEAGLTPEGWYEDPVIDGDQRTAEEAEQDGKIAQILNSDRVHPLAKEIVKLKLEDRPEKEIAEILGVPPHVVRYRFERIAVELEREDRVNFRNSKHTPVEISSETVPAETVEAAIESTEADVVAVETAATVITFPTAKIAKTEGLARRRGHQPQKEESLKARSCTRDHARNSRRRRPARFGCRGIDEVGNWNSTLQDSCKNLLWPQRVSSRSWPTDLLQRGGLVMRSPMAETEGLLAWIENNSMVTIDQIPKDIVGKLLKIAEADEGTFAAFMARGLAYNLHNSGGSSGQFGGSIASHIANCRLRLRLAFSAQGDLPPLPLFSLEDVKPAYLRAARIRNLEAQRLAASG